MDQADIPALLSRLSSDEDAVRKMAVFKLQSSINDPAFADVFISSGGLNILRRLIMSTSGNTLAYSLQSLSRLLEVDMGWDIFESTGAGELVERLVELIVTHPLVNILRGAMSILVAVVSHPQSSRNSIKIPQAFGFRALKPAIAVYPQFFEMVVSQLNSADHALCANALMLLNALIRDAISSENGQGKSGMAKVSGTGEEWPQFIKRIQNLGVIKAAFNLMQSSALQDLAYPLLDFQTLSKNLMKKWKLMKVDLERPDHRRALKGLHLASAPERKDHSGIGGTKAEELMGENGKKGSRRHNPEKWRRLGFESENPAWEFGPTGYLGMMDITEYVRKHEDAFQKILLEQSSHPLNERCPIARASLAVTTILYEHFEVDETEITDAKNYLVLDGMKNYDKIFRPHLLMWSKLHTAGLQAFFRLWKATEAEQEDFDKVAELVRILVEQVVGQAPRTKSMLEIEEELAEFEYSRLRELQMELLDLTFEDEWGQHLLQVRNELMSEATKFVKEQRIRCLLRGAWFPRMIYDQSNSDEGYASRNGMKKDSTTTWCFLKLSHNRRFLHYADFDSQTDREPSLDDLNCKIDVSIISSVFSNVSNLKSRNSIMSTTSTVKELPHTQKSETTEITIFSLRDGPERNPNFADSETQDHPILTVYPANRSVTAEWLDGLLMLLNQAPIAAETAKLVDLVSEYGLKIRLLNVRLDDGLEGPPEGAGIVPTREGLDENYWYEV